ncbi:MAG: recombinase RecT [Clostridia bacterium]|nr:recombinase RecT [Clostridia bacterium]
MANMTQAQNKPKFSVAITTKAYKTLIHNTLRDPNRANRFIASISSAVAVNPALQECEAGTILAAALLGESLNLSPSPQLGQYYLVPFKCKEKKDRNGNIIEPECSKAQFVLGYKGYIQLAIRSGQYRKLNVLEIKEGELIGFDPLNETIDCVLIDDFETRENTPTIGYYAMFEYVNGFRKAIYWSKEKMMSHADKYSPAFSADSYKKLLNGEIADKDMWKYSSFWYKNFDEMAKKTMLRQLISRWGVMSTELQTAYERDSSINEIGDNGNIISLDDDNDTPDVPQVPAAVDTSNNPNVVPEASNVVEQASLDDF